MIVLASKNQLLMEGRLEEVVKELRRLAEDRILLADYLKEKVPPAKEAGGDSG